MRRRAVRCFQIRSAATCRAIFAIVAGRMPAGMARSRNDRACLIGSSLDTFRPERSTMCRLNSWKATSSAGLASGPAAKVSGT